MAEIDADTGYVPDRLAEPDGLDRPRCRRAFAAGWVRRVIAISDQVAETASPTVREQMLRAFVRAAQLE
jgi:hypothetical protein